MENLIEKVATENAATIMAERMIDLLTNNTQIMDYVDSIGDIEVRTDFEYGYVEVKTTFFTITYLVYYEPYVQFETGFECRTEDLSNVCEMLNYDEEVDNIYDSVMEKYV